MSTRAVRPARTLLVWTWYLALTPGAAEDAVRRLGSPSFREREGAAAEIAEDVRAHAPLLRRALGDPDPEVRRRARELLGPPRDDPGWRW